MFAQWMDMRPAAYPLGPRTTHQIRA